VTGSLRRAPATLLLALLLILTGVSSRAAAQDAVLRGRVVDPSGLPVPDITVVLHGVGGEGGASVSQATTAADGSFELGVPGGPEPETVYFAAVRVDGSIYIGPPLQGSLDHPGEYLVVAGGDEGFTMGEGAADGALAGGQRADPGSDPATPWIWLGALLIGGVVILLILRRGGDTSQRRRELLLEIALLDEEYEGREAAVPAREWEDYRSRRESLLGQASVLPG
jgi:hypothetical protein